MPRVRAYHVIVTTYGFWLPNDPRGSWSDWVRSWELFKFGPTTKTTERNSVAGRRHDVHSRMAAKSALARPPVRLTGQQAKAVAMGFKDYAQRSGCIIYACAILPEHFHVVIARHAYDIEQVANLLKGAATASLSEAGIHPFAATPYRNGRLPTPWARNEWDRYLTTDDDIRRAIVYVEGNPQKEGKPRQKWSFVTPFES